MQEFTRTILFLSILYFISFVMMSDSGSQASRMLLTTLRLEMCARDGAFLLLYSGPLDEIVLFFPSCGLFGDVVSWSRDVGCCFLY